MKTKSCAAAPGGGQRICSISRVFFVPTTLFTRDRFDGVCLRDGSARVPRARLASRLPGARAAPLRAARLRDSPTRTAQPYTVSSANVSLRVAHAPGVPPVPEARGVARPHYAHMTHDRRSRVPYTVHTGSDYRTRSRTERQSLESTRTHAHAAPAMSVDGTYLYTGPRQHAPPLSAVAMTARLYRRPRPSRRPCAAWSAKRSSGSQAAELT